MPIFCNVFDVFDVLKAPQLDELATSQGISDIVAAYGSGSEGKRQLWNVVKRSTGWNLNCPLWIRQREMQLASVCNTQGLLFVSFLLRSSEKATLCTVMHCYKHIARSVMDLWQAIESKVKDGPISSNVFDILLSWAGTFWSYNILF